jgi:hypothetical protein
VSVSLCGVSLCIRRIGQLTSTLTQKDLSPWSGQTEVGVYCRWLVFKATRGVVEVEQEGKGCSSHHGLRIVWRRGSRTCCLRVENHGRGRVAVAMAGTRLGRRSCRRCLLHFESGGGSAAQPVTSDGQSLGRIYRQRFLQTFLALAFGQMARFVKQDMDRVRGRAFAGQSIGNALLDARPARAHTRLIVMWPAVINNEGILWSTHVQVQAATPRRGLLCPATGSVEAMVVAFRWLKRALLHRAGRQRLHSRALTSHALIISPVRW